MLTIDIIYMYLVECVTSSSIIIAFEFNVVIWPYNYLCGQCALFLIGARFDCI